MAHGSSLELTLPAHSASPAATHAHPQIAYGSLASPVSAQPTSPGPIVSSAFSFADSRHQNKKTRHEEEASATANAASLSSAQYWPSLSAAAPSPAAMTLPSPPPCSTDALPAAHDAAMAYRSAPSCTSSSTISSAATSPGLATPGSSRSSHSATASGDDHLWTHRRHASLSTPTTAPPSHSRPQHRRDLSASTYMSTLTLDDDLPLSASTRAHASFVGSSSNGHTNNNNNNNGSSSASPAPERSEPISKAAAMTNSLPARAMTAGTSTGSDMHAAHVVASGASTTRFACPDCGKLYKHPGCLGKHRWEHHEHWSSVSRLLLTKHQQVQLMEAAQILVTIASNDAQQQQQQHDGMTATDHTATARPATTTAP
ncbi:hypothetical protein SYNPS1DRAFT_31813 [Syncephalis pseudoplumigaleata]|uniref:C2H2-type domain-containing protein n=1 Tax=Syncephalis pseudoplumigaleata TaxID=1712513 RepID=A0A4P9YTT1_9FUNG|nr:hypothetical protein SYNPS1DRAFT_31813 [Syncephalis pseudoplumigaleata]|eukprot:RKP22581.1 hypothetical protein SYNPS1DRAFT_31813 [Syncephalis pseudoplumigaleata]